MHIRIANVQPFLVVSTATNRCVCMSLLCMCLQAWKAKHDAVVKGKEQVGAGKGHLECKFRRHAIDLPDVHSMRPLSAST